METIDHKGALLRAMDVSCMLLWCGHVTIHLATLIGHIPRRVNFTVY